MEYCVLVTSLVGALDAFYHPFKIIIPFALLQVSIRCLCQIYQFPLMTYPFACSFFKVLSFDKSDSNWYETSPFFFSNQTANIKLIFRFIEPFYTHPQAVKIESLKAIWLWSACQFPLLLRQAGLTDVKTTWPKESLWQLETVICITNL